VALFAFDLLLIGNRSLLNTPLLQRRALLRQHCRPGGVIHLSECTVSASLADLRRCFSEALAAGAEGLVVKAASGPYQAGRRGWLWIKYKREYQARLADSFDLVIVGAMRGRGRRAGSYGSLLLAAFDPAANRYYSLTKVGAGLSDRLLRELPSLLRPLRLSECHPLVQTGIQADLWFRPAKVVEVTGANLTLSPVHTVARNRLRGRGLALRFPRFVRLRDDKGPEQATSVAEIYQMYRSAASASAARQ
jgi:DNA ligase-1